MKKKIIYLCLVITLFLSMNISVIEGAGKTNTKFTDITDNYSWATEAIDELTSRGIIDGIDGKTFAPDSPVTKE